MAKRQGLTDDDIRKSITKAKATGEGAILRDTGKTTGLQCVVSYGGAASFSLLYTPRGSDKPRRLKLGRFEQTYGIAQARLEVGRIRAEMADGLDPIIAREQEEARQREALAEQRKLEAERKAAAEADARRITVTKLAELYFAARAADPGMKRARGMIDFSVLPVIGKVHADKLRKTDVQRVIDEVVSRGNSVQAHRVLEALRPMLKWAIDHEYLTPEQGEPWKKLRLPEKGEARERVLTARELRWLWDRCEEWSESNPNLSRIVRLDILLGQRSNETCQIERSEVSGDFLFWTIPGARTKNGKPHAIPLPPLARSIMREALEVFDEAVKDDAERVHLFLGKRGAVARADDIAHEIADIIAAWNAEHDADEQIAEFTPHDLRRTMATRLEETGTPLTVIESCLNHVSAKKGSVTRKHYAHGDQSLPIRHALTKWQALVEQCIAGRDPFEVRAEDIEAIEARAFAEASGGRPKLRIAGGNDRG